MFVTGNDPVITLKRALEGVFGPLDVQPLSIGKKDDPARLIAWLVTDEAAWITGQDKMAAFQTGLKIRSGAVNVNGAVMSSYASGGGIKMSGLGRERGVEGLRELARTRTVPAD